ncbi:MAG: HPr family phosphocarrier protein [Geminicoccaceae bacterium]
MVTASVSIDHPVGLHARPAIAFTKLAKTFKAAEIEIRGGDDQPWIAAKSIVRVMALKLRTGAVLQMRATGDGAEAAIEALKQLVERDFDETDAVGETGAVRGTGAVGGATSD